MASRGEGASVPQGDHRDSSAESSTTPPSPRPSGSARGVVLKREALLAKIFPSRVARPKLGRYDVIGFIGEGGMGTVFAAHDPRLERSVAIKSVRKDVGGPARRARLLREAKVLAQLDHPNVVTVHEVWEEDGEIYIAMELVEGRDLARWQQQPRPWTEIVGAYRQAGEGLAAVHEAGLVFRDFKPANAIRRDDDGVVKLLDFGLARAEDRPTQSTWTLRSVGISRGASEHTHQSRPTPSPTGEALTHAGALVGTPAYMAPEQLGGEAADSRSDQFSFAVSLHEALFGQRPFTRTSSGGAVGELDERWVAPPRDHGVPRWVCRVVERGLARDRADRYPSMSALLRDLGRDPAQQRRRIAGVIAIAGAALMGGVAIADPPAAPSSRCVPLASWWDPARRDSVRRGVETVGERQAASTWALLEPRLARHAAQASQVHLEVCQAHERGLLPTEHYALQTLCLDRAEASFAQLVELLSQGEDAAVRSANKAATQLPSPLACTSLEALTAEQPPPEDPQVAARVSALRQQLARASTEESAGLYTEAAERAGTVVDQAEALRYPPLHAEALLHRGSAKMQLRDPGALADLDQALWIAITTEQRRVAAEAAAKRIFVRAAPHAEDMDVSETIGMARSLAQRAGASGWRTRWTLSNNVGVAHQMHGDFVDSLGAYERALTQIPEGDEGRFERATTLGNMAWVQQRLGRSDDAITSSERAVEDITALLGPHHPRVLEVRASAARTLRFAGRYARAREILDEVLELYVAPQPAPLFTLFEAVEVALQQGDVAAARARLHQAQAQLAAPDASPMWQATFEAKGAELAAAEGDPSPLSLLDARGVDIGPHRRAKILTMLGRAAEAQAILEPLVDDGDHDDPQHARRVLLLARALLAQRQWVQAHARLAPLLEAEDLPLRLGVLDHADLHLALAEAEAGMGHADRAPPRVAEALRLLSSFDPDSRPVAEARALEARLSAD